MGCVATHNRHFSGFKDKRRKTPREPFPRIFKKDIQVRLVAQESPQRPILRQLSCAWCGHWFTCEAMGGWGCTPEHDQKARAGRRFVSPRWE